jgi:hypothetical protein
MHVHPVSRAGLNLNYDNEAPRTIKSYCEL